MDEIDEVVYFCEELGLPTTLDDIGLEDVSKEDLMKVAQAACAEGESIYAMPVDINKNIVYSGIVAADSYVTKYFK